MIKRQYLETPVLLCGESDGTVFKRTFNIVKMINNGASSVCYEAFYGKSGRGVLKEFYPQNIYTLMRGEKGQLVNDPMVDDVHELFLKAEKE